MKFKAIAVLLFVLPITFSTASYRCGKTLKIAIVDTGLNLQDPRFEGHICKTGHKAFVGNSITDYNKHGTHVAGIIQKYAGDGDYCFLIYKYYSDNVPGMINLQNEIKALNQAVKDGADIVNYSGGGPLFEEDEYLVIKENPNVKFVVSVGNENQNINTPLGAYYPASYHLPNEFVVGSTDSGGRRAPNSNWTNKRMYWEIGVDVLSTLPNNKAGYMSGTSMATATFSGKLVAKSLETCDYRGVNANEQ